MFRKIEIWIVLLILIFFIIITIFFGSILKHHYSGGKNFPRIQKISVFLAELPSNIDNVTEILLKKSNSNKPRKLRKNSNLPNFNRFIKTDRNALLILPRYNGDIERSVVDIIDLNTFEVIHFYKQDISKMNDLIDTSNIEHERIKIDDSPIRFEYRHPLILDDGSLIADSDYYPLFKLDFCSNLVWINQKERFHHSKMLDKDGNIWVGSQMFPYSKFIKKNKKEFGFNDDAIAKVDKNGNILFIKSVSEILSENQIISETLFLSRDPIHLNDIEPAFTTTKYWNKGDLFISIRDQSAIMHYRPSTNKVINYIQGPFYMQHDVDIISDKEISIFNNNNSVLENNQFSEVLIYNFETSSFFKKFNDQLQNENFKTTLQGLSEILKDGSMLVDEQNHGRLIFFNNNGEKEWEFVNKDSKGDVYFMSWPRIIEDEELILKIKNKIRNNKCLN